MRLPWSLARALVVWELARRRNVFGEKNDSRQNRGNAVEKLGWDGRQAIDQRLQMANPTQIVGKKISRLFAKGFDQLDEVLEIETALVRFQPRKLRRGDSNASRHFGLASPFHLPELPENSSVHSLYPNQSRIVMESRVELSRQGRHLEWLLQESPAVLAHARAY